MYSKELIETYAKVKDADWITEHENFLKLLRRECYAIISKIIKHKTFKAMEGHKRLFHAVNMATLYLAKQTGLDQAVIKDILLWEILTEMATYEKILRTHKKE